MADYQVETDLKSALAHKPDAVIIATPSAFHLDAAIPAAKQGCHILLEKPISHSMDRVSESLNCPGNWIQGSDGFSIQVPS